MIPTTQFHQLADSVTYEELFGIVVSLIVRMAVSHPDGRAMLVIDLLREAAIETIDGVLDGTIPIGAATMTHGLRNQRDRGRPTIDEGFKYDATDLDSARSRR
jgi:hypothetical protein